MLLVKCVTWTGGICLICSYKPDGECGHINQIMTAHVTCVTGPMTNSHVTVINCQIFNLHISITTYVYHYCRS